MGDFFKVTCQSSVQRTGISQSALGAECEEALKDAVMEPRSILPSSLQQVRQRSLSVQSGTRFPEALCHQQPIRTWQALALHNVDWGTGTKHAQQGSLRLCVCVCADMKHSLAPLLRQILQIIIMCTAPLRFLLSAIICIMHKIHCFPFRNNKLLVIFFFLLNIMHGQIHLCIRRVDVKC